MFTRHDEHVVGILNDWDLSASSITPKISATSKHRTGTAAFMALDLLRNTGEPLRHEYHHDLESFVWILIWCAFVLRFNGCQVEWANQPDGIQAWTATNTWNMIAFYKVCFVMESGSYLKFMTPEMKGLKKSWIKPVLRETAHTISVRSTYCFSDSEEEEKESTPNSLGDTTSAQRTQRNDPVFFTFHRIMKVLEPSTETPDAV